MALALIAYLPSLGNGFAWDDEPVVVQNETLHGLDRLWEIVRSPYRLTDSPNHSPYRPATSVSYAVSWAMGGGSPVAFHVFNVAAHVVATGLTAVLLLALGASVGAAAAGAGLFAVHPVHVEAVANVVGRADILLTVGVLVAALAWLRREWSPALRAAAVILGCALAVGAKETGVVAPALLVLLTLCTQRDAVARIRSDLPLLLAASAVVVGYFTARRAVLGVLTTLDIAPYIAVLPDGLRASTAVANLAEVAWLLLWPAELSPEYGPATIEPAAWSSARFLVGLGLALAAAGLCWLDLRRRRAAAPGGRPWLALALLWVAIAFFPVSNLLVRVGIWLAERTLYLPSVGVAFLAVGAVEWVRRSGSLSARRTTVAAVALLVALGGRRCWSRSPIWRSTETVMASLVEEHPESFRAQWWVAEQLMNAGRAEQGLTRYRQAVAMNPNEAFLVLGFARALLLAGQAAEAERVVRPIPAARDPARSVYLAQSLIFQGREGEARAVVREGLERFPGDNRLRGQAEQLGLPVEAAVGSGP